MYYRIPGFFIVLVKAIKSGVEIEQYQIRYFSIALIGVNGVYDPIEE